MARIAIDGSDLVVRQGALDRLVSLRGDLRYPLERVTGITADPGAGAEPKGVRAPETAWPGLITAGTYHRDGQRTFWNIRRGTRAVVVGLRDCEFDRLVIEVADPIGTVAQVNGARRSLA